MTAKATVLDNVHVNVEQMSLAEAEEILAGYMDEMRAEKADKERNEINQRFKLMLRRTLALKGAFKYEFAKLPMCKLAASDNAFRIFNWNVANNDRTHQYFAFILKKSKHTKGYEVIELKDRRADIPKPEQQVLFQTHWIGALYYKIIPVKRNGRKYYTMLGWDGNNSLTQKKIVDVISFASKGRVKLGAPLFKNEKGKVVKRLIFEYSADVMFKLNYVASDKVIVFDNLEPQHGTQEGHPEFLSPDGSLNGYKLQGGRWILVEDVNPNNPRERREEYNAPDAPIVGGQ